MPLLSPRAFVYVIVVFLSYWSLTSLQRSLFYGKLAVVMLSIVLLLQLYFVDISILLLA